MNPYNLTEYVLLYVSILISYNNFFVHLLQNIINFDPSIFRSCGRQKTTKSQYENCFALALFEYAKTWFIIPLSVTSSIHWVRRKQFIASVEYNNLFLGHLYLDMTYMVFLPWSIQMYERNMVNLMLIIVIHILINTTNKSTMMS